MVDGDGLTDEDREAQAEEAKLAEEQRVKDEEAKKAAGAAEQAKKDEEAKAAAAAAQQGVQPKLTEEQWQALEKQTKLSREQLVTISIMQQNQLAVSPMAKLLEKEIVANVKNGLPKEFHGLESEVLKEIEAMPVQDRQNAEKVKERFFVVQGRLMAQGKKPPAPGPGTTRVITGVQDGASGSDDNPAGGSDTTGMTADEKEVAARYGFKNKADMEKTGKNKELNLKDEQNFVPKWH